MLSAPRLSCPSAMLFIATALGAACAPSPHDARSTVSAGSIRDSAGVTIRENQGSGWPGGQGWAVSSSPELVIGRTEGDSAFQLGNVVSVVGLHGHRIAVFNGNSSQVLLFDSSGVLVRSFGRRGQGPGEFGRAQHMTRIEGDRLVVWDINYGPAATFDTTGRLLGTRVTDLGRLFSVLGPVVRSEYHTPLPNGSIVAHVSKRTAPPQPTDAVVREPKGFVLLSDSLVPHPLGWYHGLSYVRRPKEGKVEVLIPLFPANAVITGGGTPLRVYVTDGSMFDISVFDASGRLLQSIRNSAQPREVPARVIDSVRSVLSHRAMLRGGRAILPTYDGRQFYPAIITMRVDSQGCLWTLGPERTWSVFGSDGKFLGDVVIPIERVHEIGRDYVLGVSVDADGVERIVRYGLKRSTSLQ